MRTDLPLLTPEGIQMSIELDPIEEMIGKPLEQMAPAQLARYITYYQREANSIQLVDPPGVRETSTFKSLQGEYGKERTAALLRHIFLKEGGRLEVRKGEQEYISHRHFTTAMRWWTDKLDIALQVEANDDPEDDIEFVFATEL